MEIYVVQPGDTPESIAALYGVSPCSENGVNTRIGRTPICQAREIIQFSGICGGIKAPAVVKP